ncbi:MAG: hypothetical protein GTO63_04435 [Anaerolineae bacterium]|nr:hypothetical protein [Anaerolineae bacterium]NIN94255.1 hypothetical protein [Anaerolineae bacterium]NIQ77321.1 hypothetical protein [Anaerolineae bacterium]
MTAEYYPVIRLSLKTDDLTMEITSPEDREVPSFCKETVGTFEVIRGDEPWPLASLVYCAEPEPGQARIQAREQNNYDLLHAFCEEHGYARSAAKIQRMLNMLLKEGFASFA